MALEGTLRVTPEQLSSTAQEFESIASVVANLSSEISGKASNLSSSWEGEASSAYVSKLTALNNDVQDVVRYIRTHATELQEMAQNYQSTEQANASQASGLPTNVID